MRYSEWHAPLVNTLLGLPLIGADLEPLPPPDGAPPQARYWFWNNGSSFARAHAERYHALLLRARWVSLVLALALGLLVFQWTRELRGGGAGLLCGSFAATACLFYPDVLAHSRFDQESILKKVKEDREHTRLNRQSQFPYAPVCHCCSRTVLSRQKLNTSSSASSFTPNVTL